MNDSLIKGFKLKLTKLNKIMHVLMVVIVSIISVILVLDFKNNFFALIILGIPIFLFIYMMINNFISPKRETLLLYNGKIIQKNPYKLFNDPVNIDFKEIEEVEISPSNMFFFNNGQLILILNTDKLRSRDFNFMKDFFIEKANLYDYTVNDITN